MDQFPNQQTTASSVLSVSSTHCIILMQIMNILENLLSSTISICISERKKYLFKQKLPKN